jgi:transcriptional regulator with XRE-family HTH domain
VNRLQRLVRERLDERGWTLNHLSMRSQVPRQTVYKIMRAEQMRSMPEERTLRGLARGLELPERMLREAAAESIGIRIYDEPVTDPDTQVVIATMEQLPAARRKQIRKMAEILAEEYLRGQA